MTRTPSRNFINIYIYTHTQMYGIYKRGNWQAFLSVMITEHNTNIFLGSSLESVFQSRVSHKSACQHSFFLSTLIADVSITVTQDISERSVRVLNQHLLCAQTSSVPVLHGFSLKRQENLQGTPKTAFGRQRRAMMKILRATGVNGNSISITFTIIYST